MCYHVNFAKFLRARSLTEYLRWLLLHVKTDIYLNVIDKDCNFLIITEVVVQRCSVEEVLLEILQNSQENTCTRSAILFKKRLWQRCFPVIFFPVKFTKFLRTPFFTELLRKSFFFVRVFELFTPKVCEMFIYKHTVTIE